MTTADIVGIIVSFIVALMAVYASIVGWLSKHTISEFEKRIEELKKDMEFQRLSSASAHNRSDVGIARLDTLLNERMSDVEEIKAILNDIRSKFVCKQDLKDAMKEIKETLENFHKFN